MRCFHLPEPIRHPLLKPAEPMRALRSDFLQPGSVPPETYRELRRSEEHTSELQSPCNLVCRIIISEEHTSELQSPCNLVCRLLLEKKNTTAIRTVPSLIASSGSMPNILENSATDGSTRTLSRSTST